MGDKRGAKRQHWEGHIQAWRQSNLTQVKYCQKHQLNVSTFRYWVAKKKRKPLSLVKVPLSLSLLGKAGSPPSLTIVINERYKIELQDSFNPETLHKAVRILEGINASGAFQ